MKLQPAREAFKMHVNFTPKQQLNSWQENPLPTRQNLLFDVPQAGTGDPDEAWP
jgi:hypothetical protein